VVDVLYKMDSETIVAIGGGGGLSQGFCFKRIDVKTLNLSSHEPYTTLKPVPEVHLFAFNFNFKLPEKISVQEGNADKGTVTFSYRPIGTKTNTVCTYKGGAPTVKKGQPRPITKEFVFEKCSAGGGFNELRSGAWFQFKVNGNTQLAGAVKTSASVTLAREP
jgi:hypothetical protein